MPFHDLNVPYTTDHAALAQTLAFHAELGFSVVAIAIAETGKLPTTPPPIPVSSLTVPRSISTVLTRLTITISDATQNHRLASFQPHYSLVALRPTTEKALQLCCNSLECDLISLDFSQRLPFVLKFKTVASALQRGVRFEICYAPSIQSGHSDARRNLISGALALIRATRGRGIILSSEAKNALGVRGPYDVINLAQVWGLGQERGKEALCEEAGKVVRLAALKRTSFRGVVDVIDGGGGQSNSSTQPHQSAGVSKEQSAAQQQQQQHQRRPGVGSKKQGQTVDKQQPKLSNGMKRKASFSSSNTTPADATNASSTTAEDKPRPAHNKLSKEAKKARLEAPSGK